MIYSTKYIMPRTRSVDSNKLTKEEKRRIVRDLLIVVISIIFAIVLVKSPLLEQLLHATRGFKMLGSFIAGLFFTSVFTTTPAIVTLAELSQSTSVFNVAFVGAIGSVLGDLIIFRFVRDSLSEHIATIIKKRRIGKKKATKKQLTAFRWISFVVAAFIIASPLPDELGISLLGLSKLKMSWFIVLAFFGNFLGILLIGLAANAIL